MQCSWYVYQRICLLYALRSCCCFHPEYGTMIQFGSPTQDCLVVIAFCEKQLPYISFGCTRAFKLVYQQGLIAEITMAMASRTRLRAPCAVLDGCWMRTTLLQRTSLQMLGRVLREVTTRQFVKFILEKV